MTTDIATWLRLLHPKGEVFEIRVPEATLTERFSRTVFGYFDDPDQAAAAIRPYVGKDNIYQTLQRIDPALLGRAYNRLKKTTKRDTHTADKDVLAYRWLPVDTDPVRPAGISASETELKVALNKAAAIKDYLVNEWGFPDPVRGMSGNGGHLLWRIDLPAQQPAASLVQGVLQHLAGKFDDEAVKVDTTVYNASRVWKVYGTAAAKGDSIPGRPHRVAKITQVPDEIITIPVELLKAVASVVMPSTKKIGHSAGQGYTRAEIERALNELGVVFAAKDKSDKGGQPLVIFELETCLTGPEHGGSGFCVMLFANGAAEYKCLHNTCREKGWDDVKTILFPNRQKSRRVDNAGGGKLANQDGSLPGASFGEGSGGKKLDDLLRRLAELPSKRAADVQKWAWSIADEALYLDRAELGQLTDEMNRLGVSARWLSEFAVAIRERRKAAWREQKRRQALQEAKAAGLVDESDSGANSLPQIVVSNRHMRDITADAFAALLAKNEPPTIFVRGAMLTRIRVDETDKPSAEAMTDPAMRGVLDRVANFVRAKPIKDTDELLYTPIPPPAEIVSDFTSLKAWDGVPALVGITTAPVVSPDGVLETSYGYLPSSKLYYHHSGLTLGNISATKANVEVAKKRIFHDMLGDFPFVDQASRANALAALLLPFIRPAFAGPSPLTLFDAPVEGTGKTLLATLIALVFNPSGPVLMTQGRDEDEWRKRITAALIAAPPHILIDNIRGKLDSAQLAAVLTATHWTDRILGQSREITVPNLAAWFGTANNVNLSGEMARRVVWVRLDAKSERPATRKKFRHDDIAQWVIDRRNELVTAALTLVNCWLQAGRPGGNVVVGSYRPWARTLSGILECVEVPGFMANSGQLYDRVDREHDVWTAFVHKWWEAYRDQHVGVAQLFPLASSYDERQLPLMSPLPFEVGAGLDLLETYLGSGNERARRTRLGSQLANKADRVYGGFRIERAGQYHRAAQYKLVAIAGDEIEF